MYEAISDDLVAYAVDHDDIQRLIDPFYLIFVPPFHPNLAAVIAQFPVPVSPQMPMPGLPSNWCYQFVANNVGKAHAYQFLGHVQSQCPQQEAVMFTSNNVTRW
jgi:hypothetical protein